MCVCVRARVYVRVLEYARTRAVVQDVTGGKRALVRCVCARARARVCVQEIRLEMKDEMQARLAEAEARLRPAPGEWVA